MTTSEDNAVICIGCCTMCMSLVSFAFIIWIVIIVFSWFFVPIRGYCLLIEAPLLELEQIDDKHRISMLTYFQEGCDNQVHDEDTEFEPIQYYSRNLLLINRTFTDFTNYYNNNEAFYCINPKQFWEEWLPLPDNNC